MKYIALLRGINVGGNNKVEMKRVKELFTSLNFQNVSTYLNSGNILFESDKDQEVLQIEIPKLLEKEFKFEIQTLIKSASEIKKIAKAIPSEWVNDAEQKTDVAYLFPKIDKKTILQELPMKREFLTIKYVKGALRWNVKREDYNKSQLNKLISKKIYQLMTVRNVNTARFLAK